MNTQLSTRVDELQSSVAHLNPTIHDSDETSATLSVNLDAESFDALVDALNSANLYLNALTYRGVNGQSTITVESQHVATETVSVQELEDRVTGATARGAIEEDTYAFTVFGSNNRVEAQDIFTTIQNAGYEVQAINATTSPPLCVDVVVTPPQ